MSPKYNLANTKVALCQNECLKRISPYQRWEGQTMRLLTYRSTPPATTTSMHTNTDTVATYDGIIFTISICIVSFKLLLSLYKYPEIKRNNGIWNVKIIVLIIPVA